MIRSSILLIGDSITAGFDTIQFLPKWPIRNEGISGDSSVECLERISADWFEPPPVKVFLCIGTNDLARSRTDEEILRNVQKIVEKIRSFSKGSIVYLTTLFPTWNNEPRPNQRIRTFNKKLEELSRSLECSFFDIHTAFTDGSGDLHTEFTDDGLHLTKKAYSTWANILSAFLEKTADIDPEKE
jgi:lysophospholipase L1-like esterase